MSNAVDDTGGKKYSRKQKIIVVAALLLIVVVGELITIVHRSNSERFEKMSASWDKLRCEDHGRTWVAADKTGTPAGTCH